MKNAANYNLNVKSALVQPKTKLNKSRVFGFSRSFVFPGPNRAEYSVDKAGQRLLCIPGLPALGPGITAVDAPAPVPTARMSSKGRKRRLSTSTNACFAPMCMKFKPVGTCPDDGLLRFDAKTILRAALSGQPLSEDALPDIDFVNAEL